MNRFKNQIKRKQGRRYRRTAAVLAGILLAASVTACGQQVEVGKQETQQEEEDVRPTDSELEGADRQQAASKEETVRIKADASGTAYEVKVTETLSAKDENAMIEDTSTLSDLLNPDGDEEYYELKDGTILWENHGTEITYEGTTEKKPPVSVKITYYLDGEKLAPDEILGKSGEFKIRMKYKNKGKAPMVAVSLVALSKDHFSGIEVEGGRVANMGSSYFAVGYAAPGIADRLALADCELTEEIELNETVEITGKCEDFQLDYTATVFSNGLFSEIEAGDIKDLEKVGTRSDKLEDSMKKLVDGGEELYDGAKDYKKYLDQYVSGVSAVTKGTGELKKGMEALNANKTALLEGAGGLEEGLSKMNDALKDLDTEAITNALANIPELSSIGPLLVSLKEGTATLYGGSRSLRSGLKSYTDGVSSVYQGAAQLDSGASKLSQAGSSLQEGYGKLLSGISSYKKGISKFDEKGIRKLTKLTGNDYRTVVKNLKKLRKADKSYVSFTGDAGAEDNSVSFLIETDEIK